MEAKNELVDYAGELAEQIKIYAKNNSTTQQEVMNNAFSILSIVSASVLSPPIHMSMKKRGTSLDSTKRFFMKLINKSIDKNIDIIVGNLSAKTVGDRAKSDTI